MKFIVTYRNDKVCEFTADKYMYTPSHLELQNVGEAVSAGGIQLAQASAQPVAMIPWTNVLHIEFGE